MKRRRSTLALAAAALVGVVTPVPHAGADDGGRVDYQGPVIDAPRFRQVGTVGLFEHHDEFSNYFPTTNGNLIIDPGSRRGYTLVEGTNSDIAEGHNARRTSIESFDLDTLKPLRRIVVTDAPIPVGPGSSGPDDGPKQSGELVHAVDPVAHRIYLPMSKMENTVARNGGPDDRRWTDYVIVIDEGAFDRDPGHALGRFSLPAGQQHLGTYNLLGMAVSREHTAPGKPGKVLAQFSSRGGFFDHELVQWNVDAVPVDEGPGPNEVVSSALPLATVDWAQALTPCATAPANSPGDWQHSSQRGVLARRDAVYVECQSAPGSGAVVRVPVDPDTGQVTAEPLQFVSLGKPVGDVLVDQGGGRMFLRSFNGNDVYGGTSWWVFDAHDMRFTGAVAAQPALGREMGAGVDPSTGRLYTLTEDDCVQRAGGGYLPVRGGLKITEAGLDPVPAPENVVPELAYASHWHIAVDPVRHRVFLRRGLSYYQPHAQYQYPNCPASQSREKEILYEYFWRVYEDNVPLPGEPRPLDDATLTTNSAESTDRTEASFLGSGSGYGARSLLVGGLDAVTNGYVSQARSLCGRDDREALFGSVGSVEVSDNAVSAEAAALDADARTQEVLGDPTSRCRPQSGNATVDRCYGDVREGALDQAQPGVDRNGDGCNDRDGDNRYAARCLGAANSASPGFDDDEHKVPRDGFEAKASCDDAEQKATGSATGALSSADQAVTVDESSSTVDVVRKPNKGVVVKVDSIARGVTIKGQGTIGIVRTEATSTSTGRDGGAFTSFKRTICDIDLAGVVFRGCLGDEDSQQNRVKQINQAMGGYAELRLRTPDPILAKGTPHGYLAAVQRDAKQRFGDQEVAKDRSLAVPGLEIVSNRGDGGPWGAGRQIYQLAGAEASTSYGIACTYGRSPKGGCAAEGEEALAPSDFGSDGGGGTITNTVVEQAPGAPAAAVHGGHESTITKLLKAVPRAIAQALRLLFNNPRELGLLAALWALLYAPCYLGDRRRAVRSVAARRLSTG